MEAILATASNEQIPLLGEISLGLSPTAPFVIARNLSTTYCSSPEASFGSSNTFTVQIASSTQWLDPLTHQITFNVVNNSPNQPLQFASSNPMALFFVIQEVCPLYGVDAIPMCCAMHTTP